MPNPKMQGMTSQVVQLPRRPARRRRARPRPVGRTTGRAWINGREVGGTDPRFQHLAATHD